MQNSFFDANFSHSMPCFYLSTGLEGPAQDHLGKKLILEFRNAHAPKSRKCGHLEGL